MKWVTYQTGRAPVKMGGAIKFRPPVTAVTATLPAMTYTQWLGLPAIVRHFHPWERARRALVIDKTTKQAIEPDQAGTP